MDEFLDGFAVVHPLLQERLGRGLLCFLGGHILLGRLAAGDLSLLRALRLPLATLGGRLDGGAAGRGSAGASMVIVDALHVVLEVPLAGKSISRHTALTALVLAKEWLLTMSMEAMSFALVTEKACSRREASTLAGLSLAAVRLQMRVDEFATAEEGKKVSQFARIQEKGGQIQGINLLIIALELLGLVVARRISFPGAMEQAVCAGGGVLVQIMVPGALSIPAIS